MCIEQVATRENPFANKLLFAILEMGMSLGGMQT